MPKVMQKGKLNDKSRSRVSDMLISLLATPFNLLFIGLKIIWSGRRLRLAAIALAMIAVAAVVFRLKVSAHWPICCAVKPIKHRLGPVSASMTLPLRDASAHSATICWRR